MIGAKLQIRIGPQRDDTLGDVRANASPYLIARRLPNVQDCFPAQMFTVDLFIRWLFPFSKDFDASAIRIPAHELNEKFTSFPLHLHGELRPCRKRQTGKKQIHLNDMHGSQLVHEHLRLS